VQRVGKDWFPRSQKSKSFSKVQRIKKSFEIKRVLKEGRRVSYNHCLVRAFSNPQGFTRFAIVASRRVGNAVVRNRVKRLYREIIRRNYKELSEKFPSMDVVIIARKRKPHNYGDVVRDFRLSEKE